MKEVYIRFLAPVTSNSINNLFFLIDKKLQENIQCFHLLLSTPGGSVFHGLSVFNFIKALTIECYTYNFGSVDSIGVVMFCSGRKRYSAPHARFLIHGVSAGFSQNTQLDEKSIEERLKTINADYQNIASIIAEHCDKNSDEVKSMMNERTALKAQEAIDIGLVDSIKTHFIPQNADIVAIYENEIQTTQQNRIVQQRIPQKIVVPQQIPTKK